MPDNEMLITKQLATTEQAEDGLYLVTLADGTMLKIGLDGIKTAMDIEAMTGIEDIVPTAFATLIPFDKRLRYMTTTLDANKNLTPDITGALNGRSTLIRVDCNGHTLTMGNGFYARLSSNAIVTTAGTINYIFCYFDGTDFTYEIDQRGAGSAPVDLPDDPILEFGASLKRYYNTKTSQLTVADGFITAISDLSTSAMNATGNSPYDPVKASIDISHTFMPFTPVPVTTAGRTVIFVVDMENKQNHSFYEHYLYYGGFTIGENYAYWTGLGNGAPHAFIDGWLFPNVGRHILVATISAVANGPVTQNLYVDNVLRCTFTGGNTAAPEMSDFGDDYYTWFGGLSVCAVIQGVEATELQVSNITNFLNIQHSL